MMHALKAAVPCSLHPQQGTIAHKSMLSKFCMESVEALVLMAHIMLETTSLKHNVHSLNQL